MTTGNTGNTTMQEIGDRRFTRIDGLILENVKKIVALDGKTPFNLTILGRTEEEILFDTDVDYIEGELRWTRTGNRAEAFHKQLASIDSVKMVFESTVDGRVYEYPCYLDEPTTEAPMPGARHEATEHSKPATAGANAAD